MSSGPSCLPRSPHTHLAWTSYSNKTNRTQPADQPFCLQHVRVTVNMSEVGRCLQRPGNQANMQTSTCSCQGISRPRQLVDYEEKTGTKSSADLPGNTFCRFQLHFNLLDRFSVLKQRNKCFVGFRYYLKRLYNSYARHSHHNLRRAKIELSF